MYADNSYTFWPQADSLSQSKLNESYFSYYDKKIITRDKYDKPDECITGWDG